MIVGQRQPREECPAFLAFVRRRPCVACGAPPRSQAAHLRMTNAAHPEKRPVGIGEKPSDRWANPLCADCHLDAPGAQHKVGERAFWRRVGVNPFANAARLWAQFCRREGRSPEQRKAVAARAKRILKKRRPMMEPGLEADLIVEAGLFDAPRKPTRAKDPELYRYAWGSSVKRPKIRHQKRKPDVRPNSSGFQKRSSRVKLIAGSRPIQSTSRWPAKGSRKIRGRK